MTDVVEVYFRVDPCVVFLEALRFVVDLGDWKPLSELVDTLVELPPKELDAHDGKHEPEDQADQQHVQYGGDGEHESVDHNLGERL